MNDERPVCWMCAEGAAKDGAEIERLHALLADMPARSVCRIMADQQAEIEKLRAQVAKLREAMRGMLTTEMTHMREEWPEVVQARAALKETER